MGGCQVTAKDQNGNPLPGVTFTIQACAPLCDLRDTKITDDTGTVFLDTHDYFCLGSWFQIDGNYGGQHQTKTVWPNLECFASAQNFQFTTTRYRCTSPGNCVQDPTGPFPSLVACQAACVAGTQYGCSNGVCGVNPAGPYPTLSDCLAACGQGYRYSCIGGNCIVDPNGPYGTLQECHVACVQPPPLGGNPIGWIVALSAVGLLLYYAAKGAGKGGFL